MCLAGPERFAEMQGRAASLIEWYTLYVDIYRVMAGRPPRTYHPFAAAGADAEGVRRAGGQPHGSDLHDQPAFRAWFGDDAFEVGDASVLSDLMRRVSSWDPVFISASAPCQAYSTTDIHHLSDAPRLIPLIRDHLRATGRLYALENVKGAASDLLDSAQLLYGAFFGLGVDRPRFFETSFDLVIDEYIRAPGLALRRDSCLGPTRRWRRLDPFGRPEMTECCAGNIIPVQGKAPVGCTLEQSAVAMGIDPSHMPYERLAQAIPPVYEQLVFTQACMAACHRDYGVPSITFDEMLLDPEASRRTLAFWLRGAGAPSPDAGLTWSPAHREPRPVPAAAPAPMARPPGSRARGPAAVESIDGDVAVVEEVEFREVQYSTVGGFTQQHVPSGSQRWLDVLIDSDAFQGGDRSSWLAGGNTHIECSLRDLRGWIAPALAARSSAPDTRVTVQLPPVGAESAQQLRDAGFIFRRRSVRGPPVFAEADAPASLPSPSEWWSFGSRRSLAPAHVLDLADAESRMDPRDRGEFADDPDRKRMRAYLPVPWDPASWHDTGLPAWIELMMQEGVVIRPEVEPPFADHPFYRWDSSEALHRAIVEADRHLSVGSLEYIPYEEVAGVAESTIVHPWVVVQQGEKWRLCHDYSVGTNLYVPSAPFRLPSPWDVRPAVRAGSRFAKYDIRDGFFHVPVHPDSRRRLVVRHPGTGRLLWAPRLPFGYVDSPRLFCGVMEAIADKLRSQVSGRGIHFYVFVDDWLVVGDDYDLTVEGCSMLEAELRARGISWAPHKHRGPAECIEFLGLLLANIDGKMSISLTRARRDGLLELIDSWEEWGRQLLAEGRTPSALPVPLASLLGKLVFASQVVWNGRTFMQSMLSSFRGHVVDWRRGTVTFRGGTSSRVALGLGFWDDLRWWAVHLRERYSIPWEVTPPDDAVLMGTDASDWGTGQLAWLDGTREEVQVEFTRAERRRPINWRELLGIVRAVEEFGPRLRGRTVVLETDNMASRGAVHRRSSKAADMQEQIRRLVDMCERYHIRLRITHTPGALLDQPDAISRQSGVEEPRTRLSRASFSVVERTWGPFTSFVGPERDQAELVPSDGASECVWLHPTFSSVAAALRLLMARASEALRDGRRFHGLALVPDDRSAQWFQLARHMSIVAHIPAGSPVLEQYGTGAWRPVPARRDLILLAYPRAAGAVAAVVPSSSTPAPPAQGGRDLRRIRGCPVPGSSWVRWWSGGCSRSSPSWSRRSVSCAGRSRSGSSSSRTAPAAGSRQSGSCSAATPAPRWSGARRAASRGGALGALPPSAPA